MRALFQVKDLAGLRKALAENPELANQGIPYDEQNLTKAHPLHRICDGVFSGVYSDSEAVEIAKIFLEFGANVDGFPSRPGQDSPLVAAASLNADQVALLYIDRGADISHAGTHGGTALHWAAWCGRDILVAKLIQKHADINKKCEDFKSTPLLWAINGYKFNGGKNIHQQIQCVRLLLQAGADKTIPNTAGKTPRQLLDDADVELIALLT